MVRLKSISEVKGIDALNPRQPLTFNDEPITVVFGANGVGKSGYIRILNHVCGGRARNRRALLNNVFQDKAAQSCKIGYSVDVQEKILEWSPAVGVHSDLTGLEIYDNDCAHIYTTEENEVAFEPRLLALFRQLVEACAAVESCLAQEIAALPSKKPALPADYNATAAGAWFAQLSALTTPAEIDERCTWAKGQQTALDEFQRRLLEKNPTDQARQLRTRKTGLTKFAAELLKISDQMSDAALDDLLAAQLDARTKRRAASVDAEKVFAQAPLKGVGEESWQLLWEQARAYSEQVAYPKQTFPATQAGAHCVLCQQPLDGEAKQRLESFERFVKGELEELARAAERKVQLLLKKSPEIPNEEEIDTRLATLSVDYDDLIKKVQRYRKAMQARREAWGEKAKKADVPALPGESLVVGLSTLAAELERKAAAYDEDAKKSDRTDLKKQARELEAVKWLADQKAAIEAEVARLKKIGALEAAKKLTSTTGLSSKKSELAEAMVSSAFVKRFTDEMTALSARRIQVELIKTRATKGQVWHRVRLKNAKIKAEIPEVLSDGERRIVSIAAFLADVEGIEANTPFIFDDPISSLDQDFEEAVVARLVRIAQKRQLIVFTHRLSLLTLLEDAAKAAGTDSRVVALNREDWGTGEPGDTSLTAKKPEKAINVILGERLAEARKRLKEKGRAEYDTCAKGICSDIRIVVERMVEEVLLNDVVKRFRRSVQTYNRLGQLARIGAADCKFLDDFMTKYSRYEHSHSSEAPVALPDPDELQADLERLKQWIQAFNARPVPKP